MTETNGFETGLFCWAELSTSDPTAAKSFYASLFGWEIQDMEIPGSDTPYTMFSAAGRQVGAAFVQMDEERNQGVPPHWNLYISVDDADGYAKRAEAAGGTVLAPAFDVMDAGRMAVIADPTGAVAGLWQSGQHRGYGRVGETGSVIWHELMTSDLDKATAFYEEVFEWKGETFPTPGDTEGQPYNVFKKGETQVGGGMASPPGMESTPPHWMLYFGVDECDATAEKVKQLGGQIYFGPEDIPTVGRFATCADPQGAAFSLLQPDWSQPQQ
jgi:predicted enzyme related to lactoylglutathione lyase